MTPDLNPFTTAAEAAEETFIETGSRAAAKDTYRRVLAEQLQQRAVDRRARRAGILAAIRRNRAASAQRLIYRMRLLRQGRPR